MVIFRSDQEGDGGLVESPPLSIPFFDRIQRAFAGKIEHEQDRYCIIADQRKHVDEFTLAAQVPDRECDFCVADRYCLFHKIDACRQLSVFGHHVDRAFVPSV